MIFSQPIRQNKSFKCTSLLTNIKYVETLFLSLWSKSKITISRLWLNLFSTGIPLTRTFEVDWTKQKFVISRPPLRMDVVNSLICALIGVFLCRFYRQSSILVESKVVFNSE